MQAEDVSGLQTVRMCCAFTEQALGAEHRSPQAHQLREQVTLLQDRVDTAALVRVCHRDHAPADAGV